MSPLQVRLRALLAQMDRACQQPGTPSHMQQPVPQVLVDRWRQEVRSLLVMDALERSGPVVPQRTADVVQFRRGA